MKALQLQQVGRVALIDPPIPTPAPDELLVRTGAAVICTSDLNDIRENPFGIDLPVIIGHEAAGQVAAVGAAVRGFQPGDRVTAHPVHPCFTCAACRRGLRHLCENMGHFGINRPGAFADYFTVRQDRARRIPAGLDYAVAALAEPVAVCIEALEQARLAPGDRLLVLGDGPFGILTARLAARRSLDRVALAGHHPFRLNFAPEAVRIDTHLAADPVTALLEPTGGAGYDAVILATGSARAAADALRLLRAKGRLVVFSAIPGATPLDLFSVHVKELEIVGACNDQDRFDDAVVALNNPALRLGELITHRFPLAEAERALEQARSGRESAIKVAFHWSEVP